MARRQHSRMHKTLRCSISSLSCTHTCHARLVAGIAQCALQSRSSPHDVLLLFMCLPIRRPKSILAARLCLSHLTFPKTSRITFLPVLHTYIKPLHFVSLDLPRLAQKLSNFKNHNSTFNAYNF